MVAGSVYIHSYPVVIVTVAAVHESSLKLVELEFVPYVACATPSRLPTAHKFRLQIIVAYLTKGFQKDRIANSDSAVLRERTWVEDGYVLLLQEQRWAAGYKVVPVRVIYDRPAAVK